jgi:2-polyprenyl-3-methyl-5-hydroxy-6-metoxy-1,4-benzoquinol methylase
MADAIGSHRRGLDVGCANGYIAEYLRAAGRGCFVVGIERDDAAVAEATRHCDRLVVGDVEDEVVWKAVGDQFDVVIFGDILEHLRDPLSVLHRARERLTPGGMVLVSLPNIAHARVRWDLLRGRFDYADWGILDRTHLRFFTLRTGRELLEAAALRIEGLEAVGGYPPAPAVRGAPLLGDGQAGGQELARARLAGALRCLPSIFSTVRGVGPAAR